MTDGRPKRAEKFGVGILAPGQCQCAFARFDMGTAGYAERIREHFGNFNLMCGACGQLIGGETDGQKPSALVVWVKDSRTFFGSFYQVAP